MFRREDLRIADRAALQEYPPSPCHGLLLSAEGTGREKAVYYECGGLQKRDGGRNYYKPLEMVNKKHILLVYFRVSVNDADFAQTSIRYKINVVGTESGALFHIEPVAPV